MKRKPTRRDLLIIIQRLQTCFGKISGAMGDRNPNRAEDLNRLWKAGHDLCIESQGFDRADLKQTGPWAKTEEEEI